MTVVGVLHPIVMVTSLDRAIGFYTDVLGFVLGDRWWHDPDSLAALTGYDDPSAQAAIMTAPDGTEIEMVQFDRPPGDAQHVRQWHDVGINMISLGVSDLDTTVQRMTTLGGTVVGEPVEFTHGGRVTNVVYGFDPDGITLCHVEAPPTTGGART